MKRSTGDQAAPMRIGLMGTFGYGNLGDAAIQEAMIQHIREYFPGAEIFGFSLNPEDTQARHGIKSFPISRLSWKEDQDRAGSKGFFARLLSRLRNSPNPFYRSLERWLGRLPQEFSLIRDANRRLRNLDMMIVSGGGQLDDYWGGGGPWSHPYTLLKWAILARLHQVKYYFVSVGAGPIDARLSRLFIRLALSLAGYRSFRDQYSKDLIESIGLRRDDPVYPDLAHSLQFSKIAGEPGRRGLKPVVGIGPVGYFRDGCWPEQDEAHYARYRSQLASFVTWLIANRYSVLFLPGEAYYDQLAIEDLKEALYANGVSKDSDQILEASIQTVDDLLCQISVTDLVVASRFHTVLLAQLLEKPVLALSYQAKIDALMQDTGQADYCFPIGQFELDSVKKKFSDLELNCEAIKSQVAQRVSTYQAALNEQYERIFASS